MTPLSATRFVADCLGLLPFPASEGGPKMREASGERCYVCGLPDDKPGWDRRTMFGSTSTIVNKVKAPRSVTVCQSCAVVFRGWKRYCERRPDLGLTAKHPISWNSYPHAIWQGTHLVPRGETWRDLLLDPPEPPFLFVIPTSGKKDIIFLASVATSRDRYPVQVEEDTLWIDREGFAECLAAAEALLLLGFSREQVETGRYHQESIRRAGIRAFREAEAAFAPWRLVRPAWVRLATMVGRRPGKETA